MTEFTPISSLIGGLVLGSGALLLLLTNGRIAGISGIAAGLLQRKTGDWLWRLVFVAGLIVGPVIASFFGYGLPDLPDMSIGMVIIAGLFVGVGTQLGSGCTSGHGICGISRLSTRSIIATCTFILAGVITVAMSHLI